VTNPPPSEPAATPASIEDLLVETLPTVSRLALAYAPKSARMQTLALLALDTRLAGLLRNSREPMLAQLRLSWWRESLGQPAAKWPEGEPLLAALRTWDGHHGGLASLVNGWEALTGAAPLPESALETMAQGRAAAFATLAQALDARDDLRAVQRLARSWALADLAMRLGHERERESAGTLALADRAQGLRLSRPLRPLMVLHGLALRRLDKGEEAATSPAAVLKAMRLGLLGF
jgi:phytoene synthase